MEVQGSAAVPTGPPIGAVMEVQGTASLPTVPLIGAMEPIPGTSPPIGAVGSAPSGMLLHSSSGVFYPPCGGRPAFTTHTGVPMGTMTDSSQSRRQSEDSTSSAAPQDARTGPSETGCRGEEPVNVNALKRHISSLRDQVHNWRDRALKAEAAAQKAVEAQQMLQSGSAVPENDGQSRSKSCDAAFGPRQALMQQQSARYPGTQDPGALPTFWLGNGDSAGTEVQKLRQMVLDWQAVSESAQMERDNAVRQLAGLRESYAQMSSQLERSSQSLERFQSANEALLDEKTAFQHKIQQLQLQLHDLLNQGKYEEAWYRQQLSSVQAELAEARQTAAASPMLLGQLKQEHSATISALEAKWAESNGRMEAQLRFWQSRCTRIQEALEQSGVKEANLEAQLEASKEEVKTLREQNATLKKEKQTLQQELDSAATSRTGDQHLLVPGTPALQGVGGTQLSDRERAAGQEEQAKLQNAERQSVQALTKEAQSREANRDAINAASPLKDVVADLRAQCASLVRNVEKLAGENEEMAARLNAASAQQDSPGAIVRTTSRRAPARRTQSDKFGPGTPRGGR